MCYDLDMIIEFDKNEILDIMYSFSNCTNLTASYHFENAEAQSQLVSHGESHQSEPSPFERANAHFCHYVHDKCGREHCVNNDCYYRNKAKTERKTIIYSCFAGICETCTPVILDNIIVGYIILGMFIDEERQYSTKEKVVEFAEKNNLDKEELLQLYEKLPVVSSAQLQGAITLLNVCISHILEKKIIKLKTITLLEQIQSYIKEHIATHLTVDELCAKFFINRQKLYSIFKEELNVSIKHYITSVRMENAKILLATTSKPLETVAEETGFPDYNYFIRSFKKFTGVSPLKYRKMAPPPSRKRKRLSGAQRAKYAKLDGIKRTPASLLASVLYHKRGSPPTSSSLFILLSFPLLRRLPLQLSLPPLPPCVRSSFYTRAFGCPLRPTSFPRARGRQVTGIRPPLSTR